MSTERKVFTYKDVEEAKKYIFKTGIVGDNMARVARGIGKRGSIQVQTEGDATFSISGDYFWYQFMSPDPEPVEKWTHFTVEDAAEIIGKAVKNGFGSFAIITTVTGEGVFVGFRDRAIEFGRLFDQFTFLDGTRCGKKVTE